MADPRDEQRARILGLIEEAKSKLWAAKDEIGDPYDHASVHESLRRRKG